MKREHANIGQDARTGGASRGNLGMVSNVDAKPDMATNVEPKPDGALCVADKLNVVLLAVAASSHAGAHHDEGVNIFMFWRSLFPPTM